MCVNVLSLSPVRFVCFPSHSESFCALWYESKLITKYFGFLFLYLFHCVYHIFTHRQRNIYSRRMEFRMEIFCIFPFLLSLWTNKRTNAWSTDDIWRKCVNWIGYRQTLLWIWTLNIRILRVRWRVVSRDSTGQMETVTPHTPATENIFGTHFIFKLKLNG